MNDKNLNRPAEPISRDRAVSAAVSLADEQGIAGLSMRKLAKVLQIEAMSLYHHVANKDALLDGMIDSVFAETEPIDDYFAMRRRIYIAGFGAIVVVVLAGLLLFRRLIGERIEQMRLTAESIIDGDIAAACRWSGMAVSSIGRPARSIACWIAWAS